MDYKLLSKNIAEYLLRVFCFMLTIKYCFFYLLGVLGFPALPIVILSILFLKLKYSEWQILNYNFYFEMFIVSFVTLYLLAKFFGIFKKLDNLNLIEGLIIISLISYLLTIICRIDIFILNRCFYNLILEYYWIMYSLIPAFLLYKFFGFLTKKYPFPFKKIGYYTSKEFPKDLYSKIKGKLKNNS